MTLRSSERSATRPKLWKLYSSLGLMSCNDSVISVLSKKTSVKLFRLVYELLIKLAAIAN